MPKQIIKTKEEITGAIFLASQIKNDKQFKHAFDEGEGIAHQYLENLTSEKDSVSKSSFGRFFNLIQEPRISYDTLNKIVNWYFESKYKNFRSYLKGNYKEITSDTSISEKDLEVLLKKVRGKDEGEMITEQKEEDLHNTIFITIENNIKRQENEKKDDKNKQEPDLKIEKPIKQYWTVAFFAFCIVSIAITSFYFNKEKSNQPATKTDHITINNDFRQITPTKETQFFSKENEQPMIWYANYNNKLDFFTAKGIHPVSRELLQPVTKEIVHTYFLKKLPLENHVKEKPSKASKTDKTVVTIINKNQPDVELAIFFKKNYKKITNTYICDGTVNYIFKKSNLSQKLTICELVLTYTVISNKTQKVLDSNLIKTTGSGFTENEAKQNAMSSIQF